MIGRGEILAQQQIVLSSFFLRRQKGEAPHQRAGEDPTLVVL
jgi:hypothetical protein